MIEVVENRVLAAPALSVWQLLEDFGSIQRWWPVDGRIRIAKVDIEGTGVGMIRHIHNHGATHAISERLDLLDPQSRTLVLSIIGTRPPGITGYIAEAHVVDVAENQCRMDYRALITTSGVDDEKVRAGVLKTWSIMFEGLERTAQASA
jgi:uncharacterized protein YndB with AHSA1/START domain